MFSLFRMWLFTFFELDNSKFVHKIMLKHSFIDKCSSHSTSKMLLFVTNTDYYRKLLLVKCKEQLIVKCMCVCVCMITNVPKFQALLSRRNWKIAWACWSGNLLQYYFCLINMTGKLWNNMAAQARTEIGQWQQTCKHGKRKFHWILVLDKELQVP